MKRLVILLIFSVFLIGSPARAAQVAGISVPDSAEVGGQNLLLNGAGIRKKFFIKIYVGALYVQSRSGDAAGLLDMQGPSRVFMHFLYKKVTMKKLNSGWEDGFRNNLSSAQYQALKPRLERFKSMFVTMTKGDRVLFDYVPGKGTQVVINGAVKGTVEGGDFSRALLGVWLGEVPADDGLKEAMLGN